MREALLATIRERPGEDGPRLVYADWLEEHGDPHAVAWSMPVSATAGLMLYSVVGFIGISSGISIGIGIGSGSGIGRGSGRGRGSGSGSGSGRGSGISIGIGSGSGNGIGRGSGRGNGIGIGRGGGSGSGSGIGSAKLIQGHHMQPGKNYLMHCGDWHTFVGRCVQQVGPLMFEMSSVSKVENTNGGDNWHLLAAGDKAAREAASYLHYDVTAVVPLSIVAFEWAGDLPAR